VDREQTTIGVHIDTREILVELGRRRMVGGQEDMIVDVVLDLVKAREHAAAEEEANVKVVS
jgi:4-hydroxy 2-oxovalerate aldolase